MSNTLAHTQPPKYNNALLVKSQNSNHLHIWEEYTWSSLTSAGRKPVIQLTQTGLLLYGE